jgi:plasmid stability protein
MHHCDAAIASHHHDEVANMEAITLRKLPPHIGAAVRQRAAERGTSLNKAVIDLLEESTAGAAAQRPHHDLDDLCGAWSSAESRAFARALADQRSVDPELWK